LGRRYLRRKGLEYLKVNWKMIRKIKRKRGEKEEKEGGNTKHAS
jgi:hypothetical protein